MTKTTVYNVLVGMTVAMGSFTYGFGLFDLFFCRCLHSKLSYGPLLEFIC